jgi:flavin-dependent dehydrogenase
VLEFWFQADGYGGAVSVEGGRSNFCFLINKEKLPEYLGRPGQIVTGPIAYERIASGYIAIGDAAGMVDPFCGEGMRHALDTGMLAAEAVARGIRTRRSYEEIRWDYDCEWRRRWERKRGWASMVRAVMDRPLLFRAGLRFAAKTVLREIWA